MRASWSVQEKELIIFSPYFVPGKSGVAFFKALREKGVRVKILTNSLSSTDVALVHAGYSMYRVDLLRMGVELYELNKNTELSKQWHPTKNRDLTPRDVTLHSSRKVWWICEKNHEWDAVVFARVRGNGCPYCSGRSGLRNLKLITENPELSKEWHPTKNGNLTPKDVGPYSRKKAWWVCKNKHEWKARINNRISGTGCPYCAGKAVCIDNCLQTINPKLARQWHPTKNGKLTPRDVTPGSNKKVWWLCSHNHEWQAYVYHRNKGSVAIHVGSGSGNKNKYAQSE